MKITGFFWLLLALISFSGCSGKTKAAKPTLANPSFKNDYQAKVDGLKMSLNKAASQNHLNFSEVNVLTTKVTELRDLIPVSGLSLALRLDNLENSEDWVIRDQPAIRIEHIYSWIVCRTTHSLTAMTVGIKDPQSGANWETSISPKFDFAYTSAGGSFDYENSDSQYSTDKSEVVTVNGKISFEGDTLNFAGSDCSSPRHLMIYTAFSEASLKAIAKWKLSLDEVLKDLSQLPEQNPESLPSYYILAQAQKKITAAFAALP